MAKSIDAAHSDTSFFGDVCQFFDHAAQFTSHPEGLLDRSDHVTVFTASVSRYAGEMALK